MTPALGNIKVLTLPSEQLLKTNKIPWIVQFSSVQSLSRFFIFFDTMDCSKPGFPVHHQLPEPTQTHVHHIGDAIQPSHLSSPSLSAFKLSLHQYLYNESVVCTR